MSDAGVRAPEAATVTAWARLIRARHAVVTAVERDLKAAGFPPLEWYDVLLELSRAPQGALRPFELEGKLLLAQYNLSRLVDRMIQAGLLEKFRCERDGRGQVLRVTQAGRDLRQRMWPAYAEAIQARLGSRLEPGEAEALGAILSRLLDPASLTGPMCGGGEPGAECSLHESEKAFPKQTASAA
jgi:DNA-binding MarR family transcriptional regulator